MKHTHHITIALVVLMMPVMGNPITRTITDSHERKIQGEVLGKNGENIRFRRATDGKEFLININSLTREDYEFLSKLNEGNYDKPSETANGRKLETIITTNKVFLGLPFDKQDRGGICTAAALLNVLQYLDPTLKASQDELFTLFNSGRSGANYHEMEAALKSLGYASEHIKLTGEFDNATIKDIQTSLSANTPVLAATSNHMMTVVGFDTTNPEKKTIALWDQKKAKEGATEPEELGINHLEEKEFAKKIKSIILIKPKDQRIKEDDPDKMVQAMRKLLGPAGCQYTITPPANINNLKSYLESSLVARINIELRRNHRVLFRMSEYEYVEITKAPDTKGRPRDWEIKKLNNNTTKEVSHSDMLRHFNNNGVFYTAPPQAVLGK